MPTLIQSTRRLSDFDFRRRRQVLIAILLSSLLLHSVTDPPQVAAQATEAPELVELEPGVRLLGKPDPSAILGEVLAFEPVLDSNKLVVVTKRGLRLWDNEAKEILKSVEFERPASICTVAASRDRQLIAFSIWDYQAELANEVQIIDTELNEVTRFVIADPDASPASNQADPNVVANINRVLALEFSLDDRELFMATTTAIHRGEVSSGDLLERYELPPQASLSKLIVEEDRLLAIGGNSPFSIDLRNGSVDSKPSDLATLQGKRSPVFDEQSKRIFAVPLRERSQFVVFDLRSGKSETVEVESKTPLTIYSTTLSRDGSLLGLVAAREGKVGLEILVYETKTMKLQQLIAGLDARPLGLSFSPDHQGVQFCLNTNAGLFEVPLDPATGQQTFKMPSSAPVSMLALSPDGAKLVGITSFVRAVAWDWSTGESKPASSFGSALLPANSTESFFSLTRNRFDFSVLKNSWADFKSVGLQTYSAKQNVAGGVLGYLTGFQESPRSEFYYVLPAAVAINPLGSELYCVVNDGQSGFRVQTIDSVSKKRTADVLFKRPSVTARNNTVAVSGDGQLFAVHEEGKLRVFDVESTELVFEKEASKTTAITFAVDGNWVAATTEKGVEVFDCETGAELKSIREPGAVTAYAFGAKRLLVASPKPSEPVRVYDTETWEPVLEHQTNTAPRIRATISHDGRRAAFGLADSRLELWDLEQLKE